MLAGYTIGQILVAVIVIAAVIAIAYIAIKAMGIPIPPWAINILWIVIIALVAIFAIKLVLSA